MGRGQDLDPVALRIVFIVRDRQYAARLKGSQCLKGGLRHAYCRFAKREDIEIASDLIWVEMRVYGRRCRPLWVCCLNAPLKREFSLFAQRCTWIVIHGGLPFS